MSMWLVCLAAGKPPQPKSCLSIQLTKSSSLILWAITKANWQVARFAAELIAGRKTNQDFKLRTTQIMKPPRKISTSFAWSHGKRQTQETTKGDKAGKILRLGRKGQDRARG